MKNKDSKSAEIRDRAAKISDLEAALEKKSERLEELEFERETNAALYALSGVVSRAFKQNIGNIALRDATLFDTARALNAKQIWLLAKFSESSSFPELRDGVSLGKNSGTDLRRAWLVALGVKTEEEIFRVVVDYKFLLSRIPEAYRALFIPAHLFSEYFNSAITALNESGERGSGSAELTKIEENMTRAIAASRAARDAAYSIILGIFPDPEARSLIREFSEENAKDPEAGALANFIRQTKI